MGCSVRASLLAAASLIASPAAAQEVDDDFVVTATRQAAETERLPADVNVINIAEARSRGVASVAEALSEAPGINAVQTGGFGQQTSLFSGGGNSNHTLVLFDGLRLNDPSSPGSSFDAGQDTLGGIARIEVVQGPMSAVYGSDAIGGVVNIIPRHGRAGAANVEFSAWGGSYGSIGATAGVDGTLGNFRYALSGEGFATDGYDLLPERMSTHTGDADAAESAVLTGVFDLEMTEHFALDLLVRHRIARADFDAFIFPPPTFNERRVDDADLEVAQNDLTIARLSATWRVTDAFSLRATSGGLNHDREERDGAAATATFAGARRFFDLVADWRADNTAMLRNAALAAGVEAETEQVEIDQGFAAFAAEQEHRGAFVTAQGDIGPLTLTGAMRVDDFEGFSAETTWRAGASFSPVGEALRMYAAYGTSFRAPTLYERFVSWGDPHLAPERAAAWEIGGDARFSAFGREDGLELGLLYRSAKIVDLIDFNASFIYANVDEAEIESAEVNVAARPTPWLTARVSYIETVARDAAANTRLLRRPEEMWLASVDVERGPFSAQLAWRFVGDRADQIYGDDGFWQGVGTAPRYDVLRASAAWEMTPTVQVFAAADNLGDEAYEPVNAFAGTPRRLVLGIRLRPRS